MDRLLFSLMAELFLTPIGASQKSGGAIADGEADIAVIGRRQMEPDPRDDEIVRLQALVTRWRRRFEAGVDRLERQAFDERSRADGLATEVSQLRGELEQMRAGHDQLAIRALDRAKLEYVRRWLRRIPLGRTLASWAARRVASQYSRLRPE